MTALAVGLPTWHPHPSVWVVVLGLEGLYLLALARHGPRHVEPGERPASGGQIALFTAGVAVVLVGAEWPVHELAERYLYSVHMLQHILFTLVAAPLLLAGTPGWLARALLRPVMPVARVLLRPFFAFVIFNLVLVLSHWPAVVDLTVRSELAHFVAHAILLGSALIMWWPVFSPIAEIPRLSHPAQMLYLFLQSIIPTVPASFLTFGSTLLYPIYGTFPRLGGITALTDMHVAGLVMKIVGGFILWGVIATLFFRWYHLEQSGEPDVVEWQSVERELNRMRAKS